jgi:hypothetical protein
MTLREQIKESLIKSREVILRGGVNCIPSRFTRFRADFPGIRKKFYYLVTGATKSSKTQFTNYMFIITPIFYYLEHPELIKPTIMYFPLEETKEEITLRFYAYVLSVISGGKYEISPENLESVDERSPLPQEVLDLMDSEAFIRIADAYEECVTFYEDRNPTGIYKIVKGYLERNGQVIHEEKDVTYVDDFGVIKTDHIKAFKEYIPNNPNEYVIPIVDHVGLLQEERGMTLKATIEKLSEYFVILRNRYSISPVVVQQQNMETTNLEAFKANKIRPTKDGLKDSKRTGEDCSVLIGLTNPFSFGLPEYLGYNISTLKDSFRVMEIVLARKGKANGLCPLYFNGAINQYQELPLPNTPELNNVYKYIETKRKVNRPTVSMVLRSKFKKKK